MGPIIVSDKVGAAIRTMSGMTADDFTRTYGQLYLGRERDRGEARAWAVQALQQCAGHPLVLVGKRVREAFRLPAEAIELVQTCWLIDLPVASLASLPEARRRLWLAVDLWRHPRGPYRRDYCTQCLKLTEVHPRHKNDASLRVMCPGETMRFCYPLTDKS